MKQKAAKRLGKVIRKASINGLAVSLDKSNKGIIEAKDFAEYLANLKEFGDPLYIRYLILYMFNTRTLLPLVVFVNTLKRIWIREAKSKEIAAVLSRVKHHFVSHQVLVEDIYHLLAKGREKLSVEGLRESLNELKIVLTYEEFEAFLWAFDLEQGHFDPYNFSYILKKVKVPDTRPKQNAVKQEEIPIALSPKQQSEIKCISLDNYLKRTQTRKAMSRPVTQCAMSRPIVTSIGCRRAPSTMSCRVKSSDELLTERISMYSKQIVSKLPRIHSSTSAIFSGTDQLSDLATPKEKISSAKNLLLSTSPRSQSNPKTTQARSLGAWLYSNPGKEFEKLGRIERDGMVVIKGETADGFWLKVSCGKVEGWVPSIKVDRILHRPIYGLYDLKRIMLKGKVKGRIISLVTMRNGPNWAANSVMNLKVGDEVGVLSYLKDKPWVEIQIIRINGKPITGWVPHDSVEFEAPKEAENGRIVVRKSASMVCIHEPDRRKPAGETKIRKIFQEKMEIKAKRNARIRRSINVLFNWRLAKAFKMWRKLS